MTALAAGNRKYVYHAADRRRQISTATVKIVKVGRKSATPITGIIIAGVNATRTARTFVAVNGREPCFLASIQDSGLFRPPTSPSVAWRAASSRGEGDRVPHDQGAQVGRLRGGGKEPVGDDPIRTSDGDGDDRPAGEVHRLARLAPDDVQNVVRRRGDGRGALDWRERHVPEGLSGARAHPAVRRGSIGRAPRAVLDAAREVPVFPPLRDGAVRDPDHELGPRGAHHLSVELDGEAARPRGGAEGQMEGRVRRERPAGLPVGVAPDPLDDHRARGRRG